MILLVTLLVLTYLQIYVLSNYSVKIRVTDKIRPHTGKTLVKSWWSYILGYTKWKAYRVFISEPSGTPPPLKKNTVALVSHHVKILLHHAVILPGDSHQILEEEKGTDLVLQKPKEIVAEVFLLKPEMCWFEQIILK